jgi:transglutaminase-like putative cysteine protease/Ca2+/Na+ antiporter
MPRFEFRKDGLMLILTMAVAVSPAVAMRWADWVPGLWVLQTISLYAVLSTFLLAKSRFSPRVAFLMSLVFGLFALGLFSGLLLPPELPWHRKIPQMIVRQLNWLIKASNVIQDPEAADTSRDGLIFIMHTGALLWFIGSAAAWYTFRRLRIWHVILPSGLVLLITVANYYGDKPLESVLVAFVFAAILHVVCSHYLVREQDWIRSRVVFNRGTQFDFLQIGFVIVLLALPLAWYVPNVSAGEELTSAKPWDPAWERIQDGWTQLFASLKSYGGEYADPYGEALALGGPRQITPSPIMDVQAEGARYWRGTVYDTFTGDAWTNTAETTLIVPPDRPLRLTDYVQRQPISATITSYLPNSALLYFPHQPTRTDRQAKFTVFDAEGVTYDIIDARSRYVIYEGKSYKTWGSFSYASEDQLRLTEIPYPDWVRERYLQLPSTVSPRIVELATLVAAPHSTRFDKAEALTNWLRTNITYNEAVDAPPDDVDPLEYFLFESRQGYCNYYASALAVMLRSQGIPARIAAGYTRGEWQEELGVYRVYSNNSHSWVEVFFPGFGWIEFEPTTAQPRIVRRPLEPGEVQLDENAPGDLDEGYERASDLSEEEELLRKLREERGIGPLDTESRSSSLGLIIGGVLLLLAVAAGVIIILVRRQRLEGVSVVAAIYDRMSRFGRWLGVQLLPTQTPFERAVSLATAAPEAAAPIAVVTDLYVEERFSRVDEGLFDEQANRAWDELWPTLLKRSLLAALARFQRAESAKPS